MGKVGEDLIATWKSKIKWYSENNHFKEMNRIDGIRSHIGSRAISVQVNNVAVSDHVFHRFPFDLLIQVSATQLSLFLCISFVLMATDRAREDAMHTSLPGSPPLSSNVGSPDGSGHDLDGMGTRSGGTFGRKARCPSL